LERRLAAILAADVVGYSRLMGDDEAGTLARLEGLKAEILDPLIAQHHGRVVKLMGDGFLVEFASVVDALTCALVWQDAVESRSEQVSTDRALRFRIGVNLGDVIVKANDLYGEGVNVAARLEELAEPGSVLVSQTVFDHANGKVAAAFDDLGAKAMKNIAEPVRVFRASMTADVTKTISTARRPSKRRQMAIVLVASLLVVAVGTTLWLKPWAPREEPASVEAMAFPLPDKPSIAVLPFTNMSGDSNQEYFADGMTEDLITDLSKISGLFVIARNSSFSYKGQQVKVRQVAEELGVRYVLEGSVRRAGDQVRINAQLIDATTGGHLWAERYDGTLEDIFALQDQVTEQIVDALALELTPQEARRVGDLGTDVVGAHDAYLLGLSFYYQRTPEGFADAKAEFEQAMRLDPDYSEPAVALAKMYAQADTIPYSRALKINEWEGGVNARVLLATVKGRPSAGFHVVRSWLALQLFQWERAIAEAETAHTLNPNDLDALEALARALIYGGRAQEGLELAKRAMRQSPSLLMRPLMLTGLAKFALGNPREAVDRIERAFALGSEEIVYAGVQAAAYGLLGEIENARAAFAVFNGIENAGAVDLAEAIVAFPYTDAAVLTRLAQGLEKAGAKVWYTREDGGYLPLIGQNRLRGSEIKEVLAGGIIEGKRFRYASQWRRKGRAEGEVIYSGWPIHPGVGSGITGISHVDGDLLCERWPNEAGELEICAAMFRIPKGNARIRWGDYVVITDLVPHPFWLVNE
jgi:TolB-like protein/class 3 adenylate cyclase